MLGILIFLSVLGFAVGGQLNRAIYRWAWYQRSISPWSSAPEGVTARTWTDCIPIYGWWRLRRESKLHGTFFWIRPLFVEVAFGVGLAALFWWEVGVNGFSISLYCSHAILFGFMMIATFIDFDEKTIPDSVTIPGTIIALAFAAFAPDSQLPVPPLPLSPILVSTPGEWPAWLHETNGLLVGIGCWLGWCVGLLPRTIYFRRGIAKGLSFLFASMYRGKEPKRITIMAVTGILAITGVWSVSHGSLNWQTFLSALISMAVVGGFVWAIRIVTSVAAGMEAMGFGDVSLMAMVAAFLGWQAGIVAFFVAPFTSLFLVIPFWLLTGNRHIPFGPFLCAGAGIVAVGWISVWSIVGPWWEIFGPFIPAVLAFLVIAMGISLGLIELLKRILGYNRYQQVSPAN